ncbi:uncharacterized protein LOC130827635 [Amaranthus tricolor]|uniref:uncharacterized protein LOC130827635 n=1 Tax=Amaranthus tricolor TaxID=29722 RepID=UPI00258DFBB8|nr:uncharacterized protein LOC130827635 [Amaranthus tricolor]
MRILSSVSKPLSSPGRTDKFPPPLMRFLKSNIGSRSRGRKPKSKSKSLFLRRKKPSSSAIETTQEPSSPKVTCIGQVRVKRSKSKSTNKSSFCCFCFQKSSFCNPNFRKWILFFNCRSIKVRTDSSKFSSNRFEQQQEDTEVEGERRVSVSIENTSMPPRNALLLTRSCSNRFQQQQEDTSEDREKCTATMATTATPKNALLLTRCCSNRFEQQQEETEDRESGEKREKPISTTTATPKNPVLLTRCCSNRFEQQEETEDEETAEDREKRIETTITTMTETPKNALLLSRCCSNRFEQQEEETGEVRERRESVSTTTMATVTPNNALLLTRCRSAPYRSSSLACQFWGLTETEENAQKTEEERNRVSGIENRDSASKSRGDQDSKQISINNYNINNNIVSDYDDLESCAEVEVNDKKTEVFEDDKNGDFEKPLMMLRRANQNQ